MGVSSFFCLGLFGWLEKKKRKRNPGGGTERQPQDVATTKHVLLNSVSAPTTTMHMEQLHLFPREEISDLKDDIYMMLSSLTLEEHHLLLMNDSRNQTSEISRTSASNKAYCDNKHGSGDMDDFLFAVENAIKVEEKASLEILEEQCTQHYKFKDNVTACLDQISDLKNVNSKENSELLEGFYVIENPVFEENTLNANCTINECKIAETRKELRSLHNKTLMDLQCSIQSAKVEVQRFQQEFKQEFESCIQAFATVRSEYHRLLEEKQAFATARSEYHRFLEENSKLYNQLQNLKGNIRVTCRIRPGQPTTKSSISFIGDNGILTIKNQPKTGKQECKTFAFNKVFSPCATQEEVFLDVQPLVRSILNGCNVCIFAYGQTGSGKTYSMSGPNLPCENTYGLNYRALKEIFDFCTLWKDSIKYQVSVQMVEVYNEKLRDLLAADSNKKLDIQDNFQKTGLPIPALKSVRVNSLLDAINVIDIGEKKRKVASTLQNDCSSRSHRVLTAYVQGQNLITKSLLEGCIHLVDLAGSERIFKSGATEDRLNEAKHINKSLSALGDVFAALAHSSSHVPYRNSVLTRILKHSLGGETKVVMIAHVSPECTSYEETLSTLRFADRVSTIHLGARQLGLCGTSGNTSCKEVTPRVIGMDKQASPMASVTYFKQRQETVKALAFAGSRKPAKSLTRSPTFLTLEESMEHFCTPTTRPDLPLVPSSRSAKSVKHFLARKLSFTASSLGRHQSSHVLM